MVSYKSILVMFNKLGEKMINNCNPSKNMPPIKSYKSEYLTDKNIQDKESEK